MNNDHFCKVACLNLKIDYCSPRRSLSRLVPVCGDACIGASTQIEMRLWKMEVYHKLAVIYLLVFEVHLFLYLNAEKIEREIEDVGGISKVPSSCVQKCLCSTGMETILCEKLPRENIRNFRKKLNAAKRLSIRNSFLQKLSNETFDNMFLMQELTITRCNVRGIDEASLQQLPELTFLDLSSNRIEIVGEPITFIDRHFSWAVAYLPSFMTSKLLRHIDLSGNNIRYIAKEQLYGMKYVQYLNLSSNNIQHIVSDYSLLMGIKQLDLSYNRITEVSNEFGTFQLVLEELYLSHNYIRTLPILKFFNCAKLKQIDVSFNELKTIPSAGVSHCLELEQLNLQNNKVSSINNFDFRMLGSLKVLNVAHNQIEYIESGSFVFNSNLEELFISDNSISRIHNSMFANLTSLTILDLARNSISYVSNNAFDKNVWLTYLYLQSNRILYFAPSMFANLPLLRIVDLSDNLLTVPHPRWFFSASGEFYVNSAARKVEQRIRITSATFFLHKNRWMCNCSSIVFHKWASVQTDIMNNSFLNIDCFSPIFHRGKKLLKLEISELSCNTSFYVEHFVYYYIWFFILILFTVIFLLIYIRKAFAGSRKRFHIL